MSYLQPFWFRAEIARPALMDFIAKTPPESFAFLVTGATGIHGVFLSEEVMDFFCNEYPVKTLEIISSAELRKVSSQPGCRVWGNAELLNL